MPLNPISKFSQQYFNFKVAKHHNLPTQNTNRIRATYYAGHNSNTNRINQE